jgi:hypothetical protein
MKRDWWPDGMKKRVQQIKNKRELLAYKKKRKATRRRGYYGWYSITFWEKKELKRKMATGCT